MRREPLAIYDGRHFLGTVIEFKPSRFAAYGADDHQRFVGEYASLQAAADALAWTRESDA